MKSDKIDMGLRLPKVKLLDIVFLILSCIFSNSTGFAQPVCSVTKDQETKILTCMKSYEENGCAELEINDSLKDQIASCSWVDIERGSAAISMALAGS